MRDEPCRVLDELGLRGRQTANEVPFNGFRVNRASASAQTATGHTGRGIARGTLRCNSGQVVEAHGGAIWAESEGEGKGSKFFVRLWRT